MIQKMVFPLLSWKKIIFFCKKILLSFSAIPSIISINTIIQTPENVFISKEATSFSLCTASWGFVQLLPASKFTLVSLWHIFSGVKSPDLWVHHCLIFLATLRKPCLPSELSPLLQSSPRSEELAQVPGLGRLPSQEAAAAHWVHQCQRYCLHSNAGLFVFLMNSFKE